ncbi:hypothetical protein E4T56_gene7272 [Termitomyces sp. T112]|nr:hypothetical protein E4T56_gene7272 [Termitomyces sp. T112]
MAHASLAKNPRLVVTAIFQMWLQWFKTAGSGVEWPELATVEKECRQLYKQYKGEEWVCPFDVHFVPVNPSLEFLMDNLTAGMMVSAPAVTSASNTAKHPVGALVVARGEGQSEGCGDDEAANHGNIQEVGPLTPKPVAGGITRGLEEAVIGGSGGAKVKSREVVESDEDNNDSNSDVPLAQKRAASPAEEGEGDVEMRETTSLSTVTEAEWEASDMEVKGKEELKAVPATAEEDKEEKRAEEVKRTWSDMPLHQVGDDKLEWLGEDLGWPTPLTSVVLLVDFDKRVAGVEQQFQRELEVAREELLAAWAHYTITKRTLATLAGYWHDCQAFLAWQEENNVGEGDWEDAKAIEVPDDDTDLDA